VKKSLLLVLLALTLVVSMVAFTACGEEEEPPPPPPPVEGEGEVVVEPFEWPDKLLLLTMSTLSPTYGALVAWSTPLSSDTGMTVRVISESDSRLQQVWISRVDFSLYLRIKAAPCFMLTRDSLAEIGDPTLAESGCRRVRLTGVLLLWLIRV